MLTLVLPPLGAPPSANKLDGLHWAALQAELAPWRLAVRLALQTTWVSRKPVWDSVRGKPCQVQAVLAFPTRNRRDPHNYVRVVKAMIDELHDGHYRKVGGSSRARPAKMIHLPRPFALWPDDSPEWVTVPEPVLVHGEQCQLVITLRGRPDHEEATVQVGSAPDPDASATVPPDASHATAAGADSAGAQGDPDRAPAEA